MKTYRRGQVDWALWTIKSRPKSTPAPAEFLTRIRRLLDIDRAEPASKRLVSVYAFSDTGPGGKGEEAAFYPIDALMLWLGLELLEMGFKQQEVVGLLRSARPVILKRYGRSLKRAYDDLAANDLLIAPKVEASGHAWSPDERPFFALAEEIAELVVEKHLHKAVMLAVGLSAFEIAETLPQAPMMRRGRPSAD